MSGRLEDKLFEALFALVGAGELDMRLTHAGVYIAHLHDDDVPAEFRQQVEELRAKLTKTPLSSNDGFKPREISGQASEKIATGILELYSRVVAANVAMRPAE